MTIRLGHTDALCIDEDFESTFGSIGPLDPLDILTFHLFKIRTLRAWLLP